MQETVTATTDTNGDATVYTSAMTGVVTAIRYIKTNYADTVDFTITGETTGQAVLTIANVTANAVWQPVRLQYVNTSGASAGVYGPISIPNERIKIVVAQGGNTTTGQFVVITA